MIALSLALAWLGSLAFVAYLLHLKRQAVPDAKAMADNLHHCREALDTLGRSFKPVREWYDTEQMAKGLGARR